MSTCIRARAAHQAASARVLAPASAGSRLYRALRLILRLTAGQMPKPCQRAATRVEGRGILSDRNRGRVHMLTATWAPLQSADTAWPASGCGGET